MILKKWRHFACTHPGSIFPRTNGGYLCGKSSRLKPLNCVGLHKKAAASLSTVTSGRRAAA